MSASRTMLRKSRAAINARQRRIKVGTPRRRVITLQYDRVAEVDYHATKGYRIRRGVAK